MSSGYGAGYTRVRNDPPFWSFCCCSGARVDAPGPQLGRYPGRARCALPAAQENKVGPGEGEGPRRLKQAQAQGARPPRQHKPSCAGARRRPACRASCRPARANGARALPRVCVRRLRGGYNVILHYTELASLFNPRGAGFFLSKWAPVSKARAPSLPRQALSATTLGLCGSCAHRCGLCCWPWVREGHDHAAFESELQASCCWLGLASRPAPK